jgi:hypothetical protein
VSPEALSLYYPAHRYHRTKPFAVVNSPEEEAALGEGWANTPAAFQDEEPEAEVEADGNSEEERFEIDAPEKKKRGRPKKLSDTPSE